MRENKSICLHYLNCINAKGYNLELSSRNGYYFINQVYEHGASHTVFGGATLRECKEWAVSVLDLLLLKRED